MEILSDSIEHSSISRKERIKSIKRFIKANLQSFAFSPFNVIRFAYRLLSKEGRVNIYLDYATKKYIKVYGRIISKGPFSGMKYVCGAVGSMYIPKLLGSYEEELQDLIKEILAKKVYSTIIDVGCAEGYYAIGFAIRYSNAFVYAFDVDEKARNLCSEMASLNNVADRVFIAGECNYSNLTKLLNEKTLIIADCEGAEFNLLDPVQVPALLLTDLLIELHDFVNPLITPTILNRFHSTHKITMYDAQQRKLEIYPELLNLFGKKGSSLLIKERDLIGQQWAFLERNY